MTDTPENQDPIETTLAEKAKDDLPSPPDFFLLPKMISFAIGTNLPAVANATVSPSVIVKNTYKNADNKVLNSSSLVITVPLMLPNSCINSPFDDAGVNYEVLKGDFGLKANTELFTNTSGTTTKLIAVNFATDENAAHFLNIKIPIEVAIKREQGN